jgi:ferritin
MLKKNIEQAINRQINAEFWSAYLYLSMSTYFHSLNLNGFASWMRVQTQEELTHAMRFYDHVIERGGRVKLTSIEAVPTEWKSPLHAFEDTYAHEQKVTGLINDIMKQAVEEKDYATMNMLQWFIDEQVEEEASADAIVQKLKLVGKEGSGLFMIDQELSQRVFTPPPSKADTA